jgi:hypothetical protein
MLANDERRELEGLTASMTLLRVKGMLVSGRWDEGWEFASGERGLAELDDDLWQAGRQPFIRYSSRRDCLRDSGHEEGLVSTWA